MDVQKNDRPLDWVPSISFPVIQASLLDACATPPSPPPSLPSCATPPPPSFRPVYSALLPSTSLDYLLSFQLFNGGDPNRKYSKLRGPFCGAAATALTSAPILDSGVPEQQAPLHSSTVESSSLATPEFAAAAAAAAPSGGGWIGAGIESYQRLLVALFARAPAPPNEEESREERYARLISLPVGVSPEIADGGSSLPCVPAVDLRNPEEPDKSALPTVWQLLLWTATHCSQPFDPSGIIVTRPPLLPAQAGGTPVAGAPPALATLRELADELDIEALQQNDNEFRLRILRDRNDAYRAFIAPGDDARLANAQRMGELVDACDDAAQLTDAIGRAPGLSAALQAAAEFESQSGLAQEFIDWYEAETGRPDMVLKYLLAREVE
jgi:hypothetical protein